MTVKFDFSNKVILVTGGTKGIGRSIAESFLEANAKVVICARDTNYLEKMKQNYSNLYTFSLDVTKEEQVKAMVQFIEANFGKIDVLVNNVGGAIKFGNFWEVSSQDWLNAFHLNVMSIVYFCRFTYPLLVKSDSPKIINISSISGIEPGHFNPHYTTTKASVINLSKYLANFFAKSRILVNCICPGTIETPSIDSCVEQLAKEKQVNPSILKETLMKEERKKIPLGEIGKGRDIASLVLFLSSKESQWNTGSCLHVNGGKLKSMC